jgi:hypothetical protein
MNGISNVQVDDIETQSVNDALEPILIAIKPPII